MDAEQFLLLQRYRRDRRKLLEFILTSDLVRATSGGCVDVSGADLDALDVDYLLECVRSGESFDVELSTKKFHEGRKFPIMMSSLAGNSFFLLSNTEMSGLPPLQDAPRVVSNSALHYSDVSTKQFNFPLDAELGSFETATGVGDLVCTVSSCHNTKDANILCLGLPTLNAGLSGDDLREIAYEILIASVVLSGVQVDAGEEKKRSKLVIPSKLKKETTMQPHREDNYLELFNTIRIQMEISELTDARVKKGLKRFMSDMLNERVDIPQISLELLSVIDKLDFPSEKSFFNWKRRQVSILEEQLLRGSVLFLDDENGKLRSLFDKLKNKENVGHNDYTETIAALKKFALRLSNIPGMFRIPSETYYWTACYHLNVRLYERLLFSVFDILEDGRVIEEVEEVLILYRFTWRILGITGRLHNALYGWVIFQKYVQTGKPFLLKYATLEIQKVFVDDGNDGRTKAYISCLTCSVGRDPSNIDLSVVDAVLFNINRYCCRQLEDYHLNFAEDKLVNFERIINLAVLLASYFAEKDYIRGTKLMECFVIGSELLPLCVERSVKSAYTRILDFLDEKSCMQRKDPLAVLANELMLIAKEGSNSFLPILCHHYSEAGIHSSVLLHQLYGAKLKPFLEDISDLSERVISVLSRAYCLECVLIRIINSTCKSCSKSRFVDFLSPFKIREFSSPLVLHWVNAQNDNILEWTKRAIYIEDWEPLSSQRRQSASIVEVFRFIEETVNQFFNFNLPMDSVHLRSLLIGISHSLDAYLLHMAGQQVDKKNLYPTPPALTRYEDTLNLFMKRKAGESLLMEEKTMCQLEDLTLSKICVKLNTLHYIRDQLDTVEESIQKSWMLVQKDDVLRDHTSEEELLPSERVDELFTIFDDIRRSTLDDADVLINFIGTRLVFWDLRKSFLSSLYQGNVESARMEQFLPQLNSVLDELCDLILEIFRDRVVTSICKAAMEGFVFVLLNGGPSRAFSEDDVPMMQDDLSVLKDFFTADGQGLPSVIVDKEARYAQEIINLYGLKADIVIQMLKHVSGEVSCLSESEKPGTCTHAKNVYTLLRILCHKKDKNASKYLKLHYNLPRSSDYVEGAGNDSSGKSPLPDFFKKNLSFSAQEPSSGRSPLLTDIFKNNTLAETGTRNFRKMTQKLYEATSEIKYGPW